MTLSRAERIARLEELQTQRIIYIGELMEKWNALVDKKQREIDNLKALTIRAVE